VIQNFKRYQYLLTLLARSEVSKLLCTIKVLSGVSTGA